MSLHIDLNGGVLEKKYLKDLLLLILPDYELSGHSIYYLSNSYENFPITINIP